MRFQEHRLGGLAHIESALGTKNKSLTKSAARLANLEAAGSATTGLARALEEFLALEHHVALQERLGLFALPIERRAQTGRALLLVCTAVRDVGNRKVACFRIDYTGLGLMRTQPTRSCVSRKATGWF